MNKEKNKFNQEKILRELKNFHGTESYFRYSPSLFPRFLLTEGAHFVAEACGAYWLFDFIARHQAHPKIKDNAKLQEYQFWTLTVKDSKGLIICEWDTDQKVFESEIKYTDFPLDSIRIWVCPWYQTVKDYKYKKPYKVAMLPSEY